MGLRYSSTTCAPPEFDDLTGKELSKRPSYRFPCPSNAHIQLSQLYNAKKLPCFKPKIHIYNNLNETKKIEITCNHNNVEILYQINNHAQKIYEKPFEIQKPGKYNIKAFSRKKGFDNSIIVEQNFVINEYKEINHDIIELETSNVNVNNGISNNYSSKDESNEKKSHLHSKYRGLHLIRNSVDSDEDESDSCDSSESE